MVGIKSDYVWLRPQYKQDLGESFTLFYPKIALLLKSAILPMPQKRGKTTWRLWPKSERGEAAKQQVHWPRGGQEGVRAWICERERKHDKPNWQSPVWKQIKHLWLQQQKPSQKCGSTGSTQDQDSSSTALPNSTCLSAAGSLPNTHCCNGQTLPIRATSWPFLGCSF